MSESSDDAVEAVAYTESADDPRFWPAIGAWANEMIRAGYAIRVEQEDGSIRAVAY